MLTHHWEQYDLTCNGKEVTETQTDGKVAFEPKPQAAHEFQDKGLQLTQTHSIALESYYRHGRSKIFDEKTMKEKNYTFPEKTSTLSLYSLSCIFGQKAFMF